MTPIVSRSPFGRLPNGQPVELFELHGTAGIVVRVCGYGGVIQSILAPDRRGRLGDVVLGFDRLDEYVADQVYVGALIGRYANRIRGGRFQLDGREHALPVNDGGNHLHGGPAGFHKLPWHVQPFGRSDAVGLRLTRVSPDGEQGYPGRLDAEVTYTLAGNELVVDYVARTDRATPVCMTQHSYFNLAGEPSRDVLGHSLQISAAHYTPVDESLIPTGELAAVEGTAFDFRTPTPIGARIGEPHPQLARAGGYDHNFVLGPAPSGEPVPAARVHEPVSGRVLEVLTTEPGLQLYSGNYLDGAVRGKGGRPHGFRSGFCLEPQAYPDSPNQPHFPPCILQPGERYASRTIYRFSVDTAEG